MSESVLSIVCDDCDDGVRLLWVCSGESACSGWFSLDGKRKDDTGDAAISPTKGLLCVAKCVLVQEALRDHQSIISLCGRTGGFAPSVRSLFCARRHSNRTDQVFA